MERLARRRSLLLRARVRVEHLPSGRSNGSAWCMTPEPQHIRAAAFRRGTPAGARARRDREKGRGAAGARTWTVAPREASAAATCSSVSRSLGMACSGGGKPELILCGSVERLRVRWEGRGRGRARSGQGGEGRERERRGDQAAARGATSQARAAGGRASCRNRHRDATPECRTATHHPLSNSREAAQVLSNISWQNFFRQCSALASPLHLGAGASSRAGCFTRRRPRRPKR